MIAPTAHATANTATIPTDPRQVGGVDPELSAKSRADRVPAAPTEAQPSTAWFPGQGSNGKDTLLREGRLQGREPDSGPD